VKMLEGYCIDKDKGFGEIENILDITKKATWFQFWMLF
jgi:hypothetical protein